MLANLLVTFRNWRRNRLAVEALARLSDHQLNDIGLNRAALDEAVRYGYRP